MRHINKYSHIPFLYTKLREFVDQDPISKRIWKRIGSHIGSVFDISDDGDSDYRYFYPARSLFEWISKDGGLTFDDLADEQLEIYDDAGDLVEVSRSDSVPALSQMAAFGLWFLGEEMNTLGPSNEEDYDKNRINPHGFTELTVVDHKAECLLNAYQALAYTERLQRKIILTAEEESRLLIVDFSKLGKKGADIKNAPMKALEKWAVSLYEKGKWASANQAAFELRDQVVAHGRIINAVLKPSNAQKTIAKWINDSLRMPPA